MEAAVSAGGGADSGEAAGGGLEMEKKKDTPEGETKSKRKMKTASQLEVLERTYAVETYPSEALRAELSAQLGLSDRQLQMWFCHRRLKDRKAETMPAKKPSKCTPGQAMEETVGVAEVGNEHVSRSGLGSSQFSGMMDRQRFGARPPGVAVPRISSDLPALKRHYEPQRSTAVLRTIAFVEAQLGEPLREDGPILGMEFDPLPPDAFGAPIGTAPAAEHKQQPGRSFEANLYEQPDVKPLMGATRAVREYQFIPQKPSVRADAYEKAASSYQYGLSTDGHHSFATALPTGGSFIHANEKVPSPCGFPSQTPSIIMPQDDRRSHLLPSAIGGSETLPQNSCLTNIAMDGQLGTHSISKWENPYISSGERVAHEDVLRIERKRKIEEARIAREVEAYEKRIRKELEKQDILRRKREEQIKKELERHDRERRKEEERLLREKQREVERFQREQRRELERREKFLQKESIRAEKMRQKEELRREKEAARQKAASERAVARKIAKESIELVDDERLELMEMAASSKGLSSVLSLEFESSQNLDEFRDRLLLFPPRSVILKKPFAIQPWKDSEQAVGNLLMVWRFLITFTDVLGIWPFTLDEFVQAFHDYDSRLLCEIHIALLRSIIKDIEDVARTPATALGANQNNSVSPGGGHPHIVEGAYTWGFDICSWKCHLNPLTWPEILRQFALSAGFGPRLKKRNGDQAYVHDDYDSNDGEDIVANLRNGVAVENAVAIMHERGISNPRRPRHRLTPGTVKFAAFHILSIEGSKGLTVLEVAEKIQKSGLRDLTTSKTPEASISAALSRDTKLFERTAPSTYCVRAAYRKNPSNAESVLSEARERIRIFKSGVVDGEDADDVERDEDSDSDVPEEPEVDDLGTELNPNKEVSALQEARKLTVEFNIGSGKKSNEIVGRAANGLESVVAGLSSAHSSDSKEVNVVGACVNQPSDGAEVGHRLELEDAHIDESNPGESWVQGLVDGEYSDLSIEERLDALVALIGVAIEGNSIHAILEERLEAANALKKQMWAEAQLDKRRMKEEYTIRFYDSTYTGNKEEHPMSGTENRQSPSIGNNNLASEIHQNTADQQNEMCLNNILLEGNHHNQDFSAAPDNFSHQQSGHVVERSRFQLKSFIGHKAEEMYVYRSLPLGLDRRRNRYWQFITSASQSDPGCGRIFVELCDGRWRLIDSQEAFDALLVSLDIRGIRESNLYMMLKKIEVSFKETVQRNMVHSNMLMQSEACIKTEAVEIATANDFSGCMDSPRSSVCAIDSDRSETSTSFAIDLGTNEMEKLCFLKRYQDFENWMWKECLNSSMLCAMKYERRCTQILGSCDLCHDIYVFGDCHCPSCHNTYKALGSHLNFSEHVARCKEEQTMNLNSIVHDSPSPLRLRLLKLQLTMVEVSIPPEALRLSWTNDYRRTWCMKLESSTSAEDLLEVLTVLEGALKKDYISPTFGITSEVLGSYGSSLCSVNNSSTADTISVLPWLPRTLAAVALRVLEFDSSISYVKNQKLESRKEKSAGSIIKLPSRHSIAKTSQKIEMVESIQVVESHQKDNGIDVGFGSSQGRRSQSRSLGRSVGGRPQRRGTALRAEPSKKSKAGKRDMLEQVLEWKSQSSGQTGNKRARRSIRIWKKPSKTAVQIVGREIIRPNIFEKTTGNLARNGWDIEQGHKIDDTGNASSSERSEYDDENGQATGDEFDDIAVDNYATSYNARSNNSLVDRSNHNTNRSRNDSDYDIDEAANHGNDSDDDMKNGDGEQNMDGLYVSLDSSSSDFSD